MLAGSRIKWSRYGDSRGLPVYYDDVAATRKFRLESAQNGTEVVDGWAGQGGTGGLEYLGCFRDHPGHLREFDGAGGRHEAGKEEAMKDREQIERENAVYVFPRSLTPKVSITHTP